MTLKRHVSEIQAIHKRDLNIFLERLGILEDFKKGKLNCNFCGSTITRENIGFIFPLEGKVLISCNKIDCMYKFKKVMKEKTEA